MTEIELDIRHHAKSVMLASDDVINYHLLRLNDALAKARQGGAAVEQLTADEMIDIEANLLVGRLAGAFPGTDEDVIKACNEYTALLRQKGVSEALIPKYDPDNPLKVL